MNAHSASKERLDTLPTGERPNASDGPSAFEKPPEWIKTFYKRYQKLGKYDDVIESDLVDLDARPESHSRLSARKSGEDVIKELEQLHQKFSKFVGRCMECGELDWSNCRHAERKSASVFELDQIPGRSANALE